jgi:hypothetical protein
MSSQETELIQQGKEVSFKQVGKTGTISLKDVPLKERRKEANKPLFLVRYE